MRLQFCGHEAGPRTIFTVDATCAYDIAAFSFYGEEEAEVAAPIPQITLVHVQTRLAFARPILGWLSPFPPAHKFHLSSQGRTSRLMGHVARTCRHGRPERDGGL